MTLFGLRNAFSLSSFSVSLLLPMEKDESDFESQSSSLLLFVGTVLDVNSR